MKPIILEEIEVQEPVQGFRVRFVHSENMTFAYWDIAAGSLLPDHGHVHEQVAHMFEGEFELTVEGVTTTLRPGSVVVIPSNARHSGRAITDCRIMDAFHPVREDYK